MRGNGRSCAAPRSTCLHGSDPRPAANDLDHAAESLSVLKNLRHSGRFFEMLLLALELDAGFMSPQT